MHSPQAEVQSVGVRREQRHSTVFVSVQQSQVQALRSTARRLALHQLARPELQESLARKVTTILVSGPSLEKRELPDQKDASQMTIATEMTHLLPQ